MSPTGKWLEGFGPDSEIHDAALAALESRLAAVSYWLPAAAYCAVHDVEHVHRLRVSTRRALAALKLFGELLPSKPAGRVKKRLKKIRNAAGMARDLDVFAERMQKEELEGAPLILAEIAQRRAAAQPAIEQLADRLRRRGRLVRKIRQLLARVKPRENNRDAEEPKTFGGWAKHRLAEVSQEFFDAQPADNHDTAALHQFRIHGKRLRYVIELLANALDPDIRNGHYLVVEELQERLGNVNDHAWAAARLREWLSETPDVSREQIYQAAAQHETQRLEEELREFHAWWTSERAETLRRGLLCEAKRKDATADAVLQRLSQ
jgi:CHAD domain-containing protein